MTDYTPTTEAWRKYVKPCAANGVEHDCTYDYIEGWEVGSFLKWLRQVQAEAWDEGYDSGEGDSFLIGKNGGLLESERDMNPYREVTE